MSGSGSSGLGTRYPRHLAIQIYNQFLQSPGPHLDRLIDETAVQQQLLEDQVAWLRDVCAGMLRWRGRLEFIIGHYASRKKPTGRLSKYLMLAAYQILAQERTQAALVVNETVSQIQNLDGKAVASFANALLRRLTEQKDAWLDFRWSALEESKLQPASSLPVWIWKRIYSERGRDWAQSFADACLRRPKLYARCLESFLPEWGEKTEVPNAWVIGKSGNITELSGFDQGQFFIQDISSQLLVQEISEILRNEFSHSGLRVLDMCAAPGGKSMGLALNGCQVSATDHNAERMRKAEQNFKRMGLGSKIQILPYDDQSIFGDYHLIWLDAPCSGTGTLSRHPEIAYHRKEEDLKTLIQIQRELLQKAIRIQRNGGLILYSVCSILKEEGESLLDTAAGTCENLAQWDLSPHLAPHGDGFFGRLLRVKK